MNAARAMRHLEQAGFSHQQASGLIEVLQDDVLDRIATKDFVELACERVKNELRSEIHDLRSELKDDIQALRTEFKGDLHDRPSSKATCMTSGPSSKAASAASAPTSETGT